MPERPLSSLLPWALGCAVLCSPGLWLMKQNRCARWCEQAVERGDAMAGRRDPLGALRQLDDIDAVCDCGAATEGDEPPEHAAARQWVRDAELREPAALLALTPRGPIVRGLLGR